MSVASKAQSYVLSAEELQTLVTDYVAQRLGVSPPFVHNVRIHGSWMKLDLEEGVMTVTIESIPNVVPLRKRRR